MDKIFRKFAEEIKFEVTKGFEHTKVLSAQLETGSVFHLHFHVDTIVPFGEMQKFLICLNKNFKYKSEFQFSTSAYIAKPNDIVDYLKWIVGSYMNIQQIAMLMNENSLKIDTSKVLVLAHTETVANRIMSIAPDVNRIMRRFGFENFELHPELSLIGSDLIDNEKKMLDEQAARAFETHEPVMTEKAAEFKKMGYIEVEIDQLLSSSEPRVAIKGEIFSVNHKPTKSEMTITEIGVTNFKDAITVKLFAKKSQDIAANQSYKPGQHIFVSGDYQFDTYSKEPVILARKVSIAKNEKTSREDRAINKRIEFGARTRMSTMDGVVTASDLVKRASKWGHRAIAIVDTESVQSFPDFYAAAKKEGIKGIYGATFNTINRNSKAIYNPATAVEILQDTYVLFDLETTGLSPVYDDIIEFGAVKVENGQVVDRRQFFVRPGRKISPDSVALTGITDEMVASAKPEKEAILDIAEYLGSYTLIAHNANFDITFVNEKLEKYGHPLLSNPVIDSMVVGRIVHPDAKRYRLENVAVRYGIEYDSVVAHRADYDAEVLAKAWMKMMIDLKDLSILTQDDLYDFKSEDLCKKAFSNEVSVIAKNQAGLKELFFLVSSSLTQNYFNGSTVFFEDLGKRKNVLLGSGSLRSRLMDRALFGSRKQVREEIAHYDYIQVQPAKNFTHLYAKGFNDNQVKDALKFIVDEAKRQGKIVIATGDVRYLEETDKIFHEIYINAKGLGGSRHYLFNYDKTKAVDFPTQNFLTTDEMLKEFSFLEDIDLINEIVVKNTNKLADSIDNIEVIKEKLYTPTLNDVNEKLESKVYETAHAKYGNPLPINIDARIKKELEPIKKYGFAVIYWISHLLVGKSLDDGYLVGSRGSVGSSIVATFSNITEVNPLEPHYVCSRCKKSEFPDVRLNSGYDLPEKYCPVCNIPFDKEGQNIPFETFLGFNADKVPDIDLNFSGEYQPVIHNEVKRLFGETHSFRAGTISTVADKTAYGYVLAWAEDKNHKISRAFTEYVASKVAGTKRTTGQHPGGIIIIPKEYDVEDFTPINFPANDVNSSWKTTHFDFHAIHDNVLKLDLLGHDDPTAIRMLEKITGVNAKRDIPFFDPKIIEMFSSPAPLGIEPSQINGETTGVMGIPEFGTQFVRRMLKKAKVKSFGDLISVSGLSHGTNVWTNNAEQLVSQQGKTLNEVISCRDNIMTDLMTRGMEPLLSFKIMESVRKGKGLSPEWEAAMKDKGVEDWYIDSCKKIEYMFPKAHATAYVMMAWRIAWFKLYRPLAYYATYFSTRADVFDIDAVMGGPSVVLAKLKEYESRKGKRGDEGLTSKEENMIPILELVIEAFARNIKIANISLERSDATSWVIDEVNHTMYPPFNSLDGLGIAVAQTIISAREEMKFTSLEDLQKRTSLNKTSIEKLKKLGVLNGLDASNQISFDLGFF